MRTIVHLLGPPSVMRDGAAVDGPRGRKAWGLMAYLVLILWILKVAGEARDRFGATVCVGVAAMIFWHVIINVGMVSGTLPVVGVTLPLISYGGSSILTIAAALGLVMNVSVRRFSY